MRNLTKLRQFFTNFETGRDVVCTRDNALVQSSTPREEATALASIYSGVVLRQLYGVAGMYEPGTRLSRRTAAVGPSNEGGVATTRLAECFALATSDSAVNLVSRLHAEEEATALASIYSGVVLRRLYGETGTYTPGTRLSRRVVAVGGSNEGGVATIPGWTLKTVSNTQRPASRLSTGVYQTTTRQSLSVVVPC